IETGRNKARSTDIHSLKQQMGRWKNFDPPFDATIRNGASLGFHNRTTGKFLCPANVNWSDPNNRIALHDGTWKVGPKDMPLYLWLDEKVNTTDFFLGFMKGEIVVK
ncbi:hypothetical protein H0H81_009735, partial [Sphagnurus paluster]